MSAPIKRIDPWFGECRIQGNFGRSIPNHLTLKRAEEDRERERKGLPSRVEIMSDRRLKAEEIKRQLFKVREWQENCINQHKCDDSQALN